MRDKKIQKKVELENWKMSKCHLMKNQKYYPRNVCDFSHNDIFFYLISFQFSLSFEFLLTKKVDGHRAREVQQETE